MSVREQREQEQQCVTELYETIKRTIEESDCTYKDVINTLYGLASFYQKTCARRKIRQ